jgi:phosphomevalonate kinase
MKHLGEAADVPIEPAEQSALLDAVQRDCPCVLGGGVPGAGGYDAVWVLCLAPSLDALDPVERALAAYPAASVRPLSKAARVLGPRGVRDEGQSGVQVEDLAAVPGLAAALGVGTRARGV